MASVFITVQIKKTEYATNKTNCKRGKCCFLSRCKPKTDFNEITRTFSDVKYYPEQFSGLFHRILDPKMLIL